jgi:hypothetical protein
MEKGKFTLKSNLVHIIPCLMQELDR